MTARAWLEAWFGVLPLWQASGMLGPVETGAALAELAEMAEMAERCA